ncbi:MAG: TolC family protein, partial [Chthoniobacteraceae bacterium]
MLRTLTFLVLLTCASSAFSRTVTIGLEDAGAHALRHNPVLSAARFRIEEARGRLQQAGRLANPEVGTDLTQNFRTPERSFEIGFTQRFPITARLRLEKVVTRAELAAAEQEVRDEERKVIAQVRNAVVKLLGIASVQALRDTQLANSREITEFTRKRVETAEASVTDATLVELEARQLEAEILLLSVERATLQGELRPLLGLEASDDIVVPGGLPSLTPVPGAGVNVDARPDLQAARATAEAARSAVALERARKWDDIGVGLAGQSEYSEDAPEGFERDEFFGLRFSLPLPLWNDNSGRVREA